MREEIATAAAPVAAAWSATDGRNRVVALIDVGHEQHGLAGQRREVAQCVGRVVGHRDGARGRAGLQRLDHLPQPRLLGDRRLIARAGVADDLRVPALGGVEVGEQQLGLDRLDVTRRVDRALGVDDVLVGVGADDVQQRVALADVGQELVAQALALGRARDEAGDVVELDRVPDDVGGLDRLGHLLHPLVLDGDDGDVGLDRRERVVGGLGTGLAERVEQRGLARVGHPHQPHLHHRPRLPIRVPSAAPAATSDG